MAYVSVAEWRPEQVTEWLKGLDNSIVSYIHWFSNNEINGEQLLNISSDELTHLGVYKLGHQELILEAVQHLRNFHYELDRENLQLLALKLSCAAHSLYSEIRDQPESSSVPTQIMADVANVICNVKPLVSWLDRPPFSGQLQYSECKSRFLSLSLEMATSAQRDRFAERPVAEIRTCSSKLAELADSIIQDFKDPMILQPATLDLATIKKKVGDDLDFFLVPSFHGIHQIGNMKLSSAAHQSGKIQQGDEIVQVNYQTVVGWSHKKVLALFEESPNDLLLTLKRRPRHVKIYGQIYMKPYRLPSRKRASPYSRWNENLPSPRPELLTIPYFDNTRTINLSKKMDNDKTLSLMEPSGTSSSSDEEFGRPSDSQSPSSIRLYLPKPRASIQRRFTLSGPPRPSAQSEQFWRELQLERSWRSNQSNSQINNSCTQKVGSKDGNVDEMFQLRDKSASLGNSIASASSRSTTCVPFTKDRIGSVKFDLPKFESFKSDSVAYDKPTEPEKDTEICDNNLETGYSESNCSTSGERSEKSERTSTSEPDDRTHLSITELNKLKRNAFFNNMDCPDAEGIQKGKRTQEGSSDRVKRVIENFKSEINKTRKDMSEIDIFKSPGKVMELIGSFEKKENVHAPRKNNMEFCSNEKLQPERKPTTDKTTTEKAVSTFNDNAAESTHFTKPKLVSDEEKENLVTPTSKGTIGILKQTATKNSQVKFTESISLLNDPRSFVLHTENPNFVEPDLVKINSDCSTSKNSLPKQIKDKFDHFSNDDNPALAQRSCDKSKIDYRSPNRNTEAIQNDSDMTKNTSFDKNDSKNEIRSACVTNVHEEPKKPVPAQRKSKVTSDGNVHPTVSSPSNPFPLPPKPRTKILLQFSENISLSKVQPAQLPPEPPPRPDNTFLKSANTKKIESVLSKKAEEKGSMDPVRIFDLAPSTRKDKISPPIVSNVETPSLNLNPLPTTPSSVRKIIKPINILTSPSLHGSPSPPAEKEKPKTSPSTLESLKAMLTLGRKSASLNSPRTTRKKNAMLAKKRNVSVKEVTPFENSGFLFYRNRKGLAIASWTKYYFVLQGSNFYGFKTKESHKADLFIHLPGFTCTLAEEVKSKDFPFKIYHTGTVFYFATNSKENLQQWLDCVNLAISFQDEKGAPEAVTYSQTDSDSSDTEPEPETCFPTSPKMKKVLKPSPVPKPARSHQNLAFDSKKSHDIQRRFGSLKKLSSRKNSNANNQFSTANEPPEAASLDRKYLRFLGQKHSPTPVPTSGFRSYRRMHPPPVIPSKSGKSAIKLNKENDGRENFALQLQTNNLQPPRLVRKPLHSSNPSLVHPEMADYRITQDKLTDFRRLRNQGGAAGSSRFMTLEQFMQTRQENNLRTNRNRPQPESGGLITLEQFLLRQEEERQKSNKSNDRPGPSNEFINHEPMVRDREDEYIPFTLQHPTDDQMAQIVPSASNQGAMNRRMKTEFERPQIVPRNKDLPGIGQGKLKSAVIYQPPPVQYSASGQDEPMATSSDMTLDQNDRKKELESKNCADFDYVKSSECVHSENSKLMYQGIEYPPAFEPETYTLQHMLRNRQKRGSDFKK